MMKFTVFKRSNVKKRDVGMIDNPDFVIVLYGDECIRSLCIINDGRLQTEVISHGVAPLTHR